MKGGAKKRTKIVAALFAAKLLLSVAGGGLWLLHSKNTCQRMREQYESAMHAWIYFDMPASERLATKAEMLAEKKSISACGCESNDLPDPWN